MLFRSVAYGDSSPGARHGSEPNCANARQSRKPLRTQSEPRPQGSAEQSDTAVGRPRKMRTTAAVPTRTALLDAPLRSRLRLGPRFATLCRIPPHHLDHWADVDRSSCRGGHGNRSRSRLHQSALAAGKLACGRTWMRISAWVDRSEGAIRESGNLFVLRSRPDGRDIDIYFQAGGGNHVHQCVDCE